MSKYDEDIDWFCDNCNEYMNDQDGFNRNSGIWICTECGWKNNVTDRNIRPYENVHSLYELDQIGCDVMEELICAGINPFEAHDIPKRKYGKKR